MRKSTAWIIFTGATLLLALLFLWPIGRVIGGASWTATSPGNIWPASSTIPSMPKAC